MLSKGMLKPYSRTFPPMQACQWHCSSSTNTIAITRNTKIPFRALSTRELQNTGSTARDHLANERTWLAWTRTALAFAALGLGLDRFDLLRQDVQHIAGAGDRTSNGFAPASSVISKQYSSNSTSPPKTALPYLKPGGTEKSKTAEFDISMSPSLQQKLSTWIENAKIKIPDSRSLSTLLLCASAGIGVQATIRYYRVARALSRQPSMFLPARHTVAWTTTVTCGFTLIALLHGPASRPTS